jgi:tetratricopeptide (TPR) repeat protein
MSEKILQLGNRLIQKKKGFAAIRYLHYGIVHDPNNAELYACLGDALKQSLEYDLALKIYRRGLSLAKANGNNEIAQEIKIKIDTIYSISPQFIIEGPQIGFFIRSIMKMLTQLGKKDWF